MPNELDAGIFSIIGISERETSEIASGLRVWLRMKGGHNSLVGIYGLAKLSLNITSDTAISKGSVD